MKKQSTPPVEMIRGTIAPRSFTYDQLVKISNDNYEVLNRSIDPAKIDKNGTFLLVPVLIHHHAFGEPIAPHLRAWVRSQSDPTLSALQDLTFEQFETGKEAA